MGRRFRAVSWIQTGATCEPPNGGERPALDVPLGADACVGEGQAAPRKRVYVGGIRNVDAYDGALVGELVGNQLQYRGFVAWGFRAPDVLEVLREARAPRRTSPFVDLRSMRGAVWLEPRLAAEVSYADLATGQLRAPSWRGLVGR